MTRGNSDQKEESGPSQAKEDTVALTVRPGHAREAMLFSSAVWAFFSSFGIVFGWGLVAIPFIVLASVSVVGYAHYRETRVFEASDNGIRLVTLKKTRLHLSWGDVSKIRHGPESLTAWVFLQHEGYTLEVRGHRRFQSILLNTVNYGVDQEDLTRVAIALSAMGVSRSIPVSYIPDERHAQGRISKRLLASHRNGGAIAGAIVTLSVAIAFILGSILLDPLVIIGAVIFGLFFPIYVYLFLTSRRAYCSTCGAYRVFNLEKGDKMRCPECKASVDVLGL